jgi:putative Mg2+ transporter-C (MgtC) family protein
MPEVGMNETLYESVPDIVIRLVVAAVLGGLIGYERRAHHKAIGVAGMMLIAVGSSTYMLLAKHLAAVDPAAISRTLQGLLSGIGFFGGAVIFKSGRDVKGIKAAAAVWITGAAGLAIGTAYWWLGVIVGIVTISILWISDSVPDPVREHLQEVPDSKGQAGTAAERAKR